MIDVGFAGALLGGLLSLLSPCSVMLLPAFFAYAFGSVREILGRTAWFHLGLLVTLVPMGVLAASLGSVITHRQVLIHVVAWAVVASGALLVSGIRLPGVGARTRGGTSRASTFLLGTVYAVAGVCAGPILGSVLLVAGLGSPAYGAVLMVLYATGMCVPLVVLAVVWGRLGARGMAWLTPRMIEVRLGRVVWRNSWTQVISGLLTIGLGVVLLVSDGTASLPALLDVGTQFQVESRALSLTAGIPDLVVALVLVAAAGLVISWANRTATEGPGEVRRGRISR